MEVLQSVGGQQLLLFVAGDIPSSLAAYGNIALALEMFPEGEFTLEVIDVWESPDRALESRVWITPTLLAPSYSRRLVGDLSRWDRVRHFLRSLPSAAEQR